MNGGVEMLPHIELTGAYVEIINRCNQKCAYCYNPDNESRLATGELIGLLQFLNRGSTLVLSGGEPTLHDGIASIIEETGKSFINTEIITNGTVPLAKECLNQIVKWDTAIQLTFDSSDPHENSATRGEGSFEKMLLFVERARCAGWKGRLIIRVNQFVGSSGRIPGLLKLAERLHADLMAISTVQPIGRGNCFDACFGSIDEAEDYLEKIELMYANEMKMSGFPIIIDRCGEKGCPFSSKKIDVLSVTPRIDSRGNVFPCQGFQAPEFIIGNIRQHDIQKIVTSEKMRDFIDLMKLRMRYINECQQCVFQRMCAKGCPGKAYSYTKNIFSHGVSCRKIRTSALSGLKNRTT